jgi:hypothetical protein
MWTFRTIFRAFFRAKVQVVDPQYTFLLGCKWLAAFLSMVGFCATNLLQGNGT